MPKTFDELVSEDNVKTLRRIEQTMGSGHHSVFEHGYITLNLENIPKLFAMVLNNEHVYVTSEKSARYTKMNPSPEEQKLYDKWVEIFKKKIRERYPDSTGFMSDAKVQKLAQENARYLISVKTLTTMEHTISYRQLNYLCKWMSDELENSNSPYTPIFDSFEQFISFAKENNLLDERLMDDGKFRSLSLFKIGKEHNAIYDTVYSTNYEASLAYLAQAQRHRTLFYEVNKLYTDKFFTPKILRSDEQLKNEWQEDIHSVAKNIPQGTIAKINERGLSEHFILKLKERLCSCAQLEINDKTKNLLKKYIEETKDTELAKLLSQYAKGSRCTFPDFKCKAPCGFADGIKGERDI
ncbi:MAG: FAD-dependent thymidylate synthase [Clostridiales bacterium]|nr:FAD-dependent thymidylate synthase [Clostridiales bacterium]